MMTASPSTNIPQLLNTVLVGLNTVSGKDLVRLGVKGQSARALMALLDHTELRCSKMSRLLGLEATALSHLLRALARKRLIVRTRVENDNRAVEVRLTEQGRRLARACQDVTHSYERKLLQGLTAGELQALQRILQKMDDNITPLRRRGRREASSEQRSSRSPSRKAPVQSSRSRSSARSPRREVAAG